MKTFTIKIKITEKTDGVDIKTELATTKNKTKSLFVNQDEILDAVIESYPDDFEPKDSLPKDTELNSFITIVLVDAGVKINNELNTHSTLTKAQYSYIVKSVFESLNEEFLEIFLKEVASKKIAKLGTLAEVASKKIDALMEEIDDSIVDVAELLDPELAIIFDTLRKLKKLK